MAQEQPRLVPVALHRALGDATHRRNFGEAETAEELQLDQLRQRRLDRGQLVERPVQLLQVVIARADLLALDTGCVWGGALSAVRTDGGRRDLFQVPCAEALRPGGANRAD